MNKPINRTTIQSDTNRYKLYPKSAPCCYKKSDGTYDHIDLTFNDSTSNIGDISLLEKNVFSVGIRKDNNPHKYVGVRPDKNQHEGTQQLEFSLVSVNLDGEAQSFNCNTDYEVRVTGAKMKQLVKTNKDFKDFKVEFDIHAKGLPIQNQKYTEETVVRDYAFNLTNLGELEAGNTEHTMDNILTESKNIPYINCCIFKITNDYITTGEYSIEDEFGDSDLSSYSLYSDLYSNGSSVYYKDCIVLCAKSYNIDNYLDIFLTNLCSIYGLEVFDDGGSGKYLTKDGKKVMGYSVKGENEFFLFVNTKEIPDSVKSLFKRKTFNDTSYLDITLDDFKQSIEDNFNLSMQVKVDADYYQPINNKFRFEINNECFSINLPILFDESYNILPLGTMHTLKDNGDGSYRYTKYFNVEGRLNNSSDIKYIDSSLYVSEDEDRPAREYTGEKNSTRFTDARDYTIGTNNQQAQDGVGSENTLRLICGDEGTKSVGQFATTVTFKLWHTIYYFDSSGITDTVTALSWKHLSSYFENTSSYNDTSIIFLKSTNPSYGGNNDNRAWNDIYGHTSGWDADDVTEYSGEIVIDGTNTTDIASADNYTSTFNSDARSDLEDDDEFSFAIMEYDQYYLNDYDSSYGVSITGRRTFYSSETDNSDSSKRPYLDVTTDSGTAVTDNAVFFGANF